MKTLIKKLLNWRVIVGKHTVMDCTNIRLPHKIMHFAHYMQVVVLGENCRPIPLVTLHGQEKSEITGPAFSPDGRRFYFSSQRGLEGESVHGLTYELTLRDPLTIS